MKWGLFSRVTISLASVLFVSMLGLGYVFLHDIETRFASNQLAQAKLEALEIAEDGRRALLLNDYDKLTNQLKQIVSGTNAQAYVAYAAVIDTEGKVLAAASANAALEPGMVLPMTRIETMQIRQSVYQGHPVREVIYPILTADQRYANVHVAHFADVTLFSQGPVHEIIFALLSIWFVSMAMAMFALSRSIKPLTALTQKITSTALDGSDHVVDDNLRSRKDEVGVLACAFDAMIAKVQKSYLELERREAHYRQLVETANVIPWELDLNSRRFTYVGPQITKILGYDVADWCQENFWKNHVCPEDLQMAEDFYRSAASSGEEKEIEYRILHANGDLVWVRDWVHKSSKDPRSPVLQGFMFDVSDRVNARQELQRYREHLENVVEERTAELLTVNQELQSFAHSLSQDLRVPLRVINGFSQAMLEDYAEVVDEEGKKNLQRICRGTEEMGKMIDDILILSRVTRQELYRQKVNLSEMAERIAARLNENNLGSAVECVIAKDMTAYGDPELLNIVLEHLLGNAWKFTANVPAPHVEFSCQLVDGQMVYAVKDNGAGFDMQYAEKLFLPFKRLHNSEEFEGAGIGLATVKRIILRHGGDIWGEGAVGEGVTFYFTLSKSAAEMLLSDKKILDAHDDVA